MNNETYIKRTVPRLFRLSFAVCFFAVLLIAFSGVRVYGAGDFVYYHDKLVGIDYTRFEGQRKYDLVLEFGGMKFKGTLQGGADITRDEINRIIEQVLTEKGLTQLDIMSIKATLDLMQQYAALYFGDQVVQGLLKYASILPGYDFGDLYATVVHGEVKGVGEAVGDVAWDVLKDKAVETVETSLVSSSKRIAKQGGKYVPMLGQVITTVEIAVEWKTGDTERFDRHLDSMSEAVEAITNFYGECIRRINAFAGPYENWSIKIDKAADHVENISFWNVTVPSSYWEVSMELYKDIPLNQADRTNGPYGLYEGELSIHMYGLNALFDEVILQNPNMKMIYSAWSAQNLKHEFQPTILERRVERQVEVTIIQDGAARIVVIGTSRDETDFSFDHKIIGTSTYPSNSVYRDMEIKSQSTTSIEITHHGHNNSIQTGTTYHVLHNEVEKGPISEGNVWAPLTSPMSITVNFK